MPQKPNLLLIWTDQQRNDTLPCLGNDYVEAPNLERLGNESFVFRRAYCTQPVCTPSRGSIMTGLWPHTHGCITNNIPLAPERKTIAEMVSDDYLCAYYGKWHLGDELVPHHGFEDWISIEDGIYRPYYSTPEQLELRSSYHHFLVRNGFPTDSVSKAGDGATVFSRDYAAVMGEQFTKASFLGRETARFLREQKGDRPFLMSINMLEPHPPFHGPLNDLYDPEALPVGGAFLRPPEADVCEKVRRGYESFQRDGYKRYPLKTEWDWRRLRANYYGLVTQVDRAVGHMLEALDESGQADNTIVVYTSDHGEMMGDHGLIGKGVMYDESSNIPLMIRVPWLSRRQNMIEAPVSQIDLVPTLLDLLDQPLGDHLQGTSRAPVLRGEESMSENAAVIEWNSPGETDDRGRSLVSSDGYKLNLYHGDRCELFDLNADPCELTNLFNRAEQVDRVKEMAARIRVWQEETADTLELPNV